MAITLKILKAGALGPEATLYPGDGVVAGKTALVKNIIVTNRHATVPATINLYVRQQSDPANYLISPKDVQIPPGGQAIFDAEISLLLSTGPDRIRGAAAGGDVQYVINGFERDI